MTADAPTIYRTALMESLDQQVFHQVARWLDDGRSCWLCTVVATIGAAPRPVGSLLACNRDGAVVGSLSGGCVEDDLLEKLRSGELAITHPLIVEYGVTPEQNERLGLPCGGRLQVLVEHWHPDVLLPLRQLIQLLDQRRIARRYLDLDNSTWRVEEAAEFAALALADKTLQQSYGPRFQLLLVGAGEIARCLAAMARMLDYRVLVCDPRPQLIAQWSDLDGHAEVELLRCMPDDAVRDYCGDDPHSIVITLTHDPRIDDMALMEALQRNLFYVGALGSERTSAKRRERLQQLDLSPAQIAKLHAPVGLNIGSKRPPEIAIAILAELTALRSQELRHQELRGQGLRHQEPSASGTKNCLA
jgi:xanthine dehydrogenase accessory factor